MVELKATAVVEYFKFLKRNWNGATLDNLEIKSTRHRRKRIGFGVIEIGWWEVKGS